MPFDPLSHTLKLAQLQIYTALLQLDDCRNMPETDNLDFKDQWLLRHTRNKLSGCNHTLTRLIRSATETLDPTPILPSLTVTVEEVQQSLAKSPSPDNARPDPSD